MKYKPHSKDDEIYFEKKSDNNKKVLIESSYRNVKYKIITFGTHPCCYIQVTDKMRYLKKSCYDIDLNVHGGLTYGIDSDGYIGWDYAHHGDLYYNPEIQKLVEKRLGKKYFEDKKWTLKELQHDVLNAIDELKNYKYTFKENIIFFKYIIIKMLK